MSTIFPREEKTDLLFKKILENPEACRILTDTVYNELDPDSEGAVRYLGPEHFTQALFNAYTNRDLTALLIALTGNSMFDLLRNSFLIPFKFDEDGSNNPIILSDDNGYLLGSTPIAVPAKDYERFSREYRKIEDCRMYLAYGWRLHHVYDTGTLDVMTQRYDEHFGVLLLYELPDTLKNQESESQAYASLLDMMIELQMELPGATVYYGQDRVHEGSDVYDGMGIFLSKHHLVPSFEKKLETVTRIVKGIDK